MLIIILKMIMMIFMLVHLLAGHNDIANHMGGTIDGLGMLLISYAHCSETKFIIIYAFELINILV